VNARQLLELAIWDGKPRCPRGHFNVLKMVGSAHRNGLYYCRTCKKTETSYQFTVTSNSILKDTHLPLKKWLVAFEILEKNQETTSLEIAKKLKITSKSAWLLRKKIVHDKMGEIYNVLDQLVKEGRVKVVGKKRNGYRNLKYSNIKEAL
jgi:hypothetical protein